MKAGPMPLAHDTDIVFAANITHRHARTPSEPPRQCEGGNSFPFGQTLPNLLDPTEPPCSVSDGNARPVWFTPLGAEDAR